MPSLIHHGSRYFLNAQPLELGTVVEIRAPSALEACHRGHFFWSGIAGEDPFVWNAGFGCRVPPGSDFRRYVPERAEYVRPPEAPDLKDHERRANYKHGRLPRSAVLESPPANAFHHHPRQPPPKRMPRRTAYRLIGFRSDGTNTCICVTHSKEYAEAIAGVLRREMSFARIVLESADGSELQVSHPYWAGPPELWPAASR